MCAERSGGSAAAGRLAIAAKGSDRPRSSRLFDCKDGPVYAAVLLDSHWKILAPIIGVPELADDPGFATREGRVVNRDACNAMLAGWLAETHTFRSTRRDALPLAPPAATVQHR